MVLINIEVMETTNQQIFKQQAERKKRKKKLYNKQTQSTNLNWVNSFLETFEVTDNDS